MGHGGRKKKRVRIRDELRWYEILMCCCKCRKECKTCVSTLWLYVIPIILMILVSAGSITFGIIWRTDCDRHKTIPYWLFGSTISPFVLLTYIKALKEQYQGITLWRIVAFMTYLLFTAYLVYGCLVIYDTWIHGDSDSCNEYLLWYAIGVTFLHWIFFIIATVIQIYVFTKVCCCCTQNAIKPLKPHFVDEEYL